MPTTAVTGSPPKAHDLSFVDPLGSTFAKQFARDFAETYSEHCWTSAYGARRALKHFFRWLTGSGGPAAEPAATVRKALLEAMRGGSAAEFGADLFLDLCEVYAERFRHQFKDKKRRKFNYDRLRRFGAAMRSVAGKTALPSVTRGLCSIGADEHDREGHATLAALTPDGVVDWSKPAYMKQALERVLKHVGKDPATMSLTDQLLAVAELNRSRLARIRHLFALELGEEYSAFLRGQELIGDPSLPPDEVIVEQLTPKFYRSHGPSRWFERESSADIRRGIAIILRYYRHHGSLVRSHFPVAVREFLRRADVRSELAPSSRTPQALLQRMLSITDRSWNAAFGLLLCDTGWNIQPLLDIDANPLVGPDPDGAVRLVATDVLSSLKRRAGHDVHSALRNSPLTLARELDSKGVERVVRLSETPQDGISAESAVRMVQRMTDPLRSRSSTPHRLWLCPRLRSSASSVPGVRSRRLYFEAFLKRHEADRYIGRLPITPSMLRKTFIDVAAMTGDDGHALAIALSENTSAVGFRRYRRSPWLQHLLRENIRAFQDAFEAILAEEVPRAGEHLGLAEPTLRERHSYAIRAGLGFRQAHKRRVPGSPARPATTFVPTASSIEALHSVHLGLVRSAQSVPPANADLWRTQWLPLLAVVRATIAELEESPHAALSRKLQREAKRALSCSRMP